MKKLIVATLIALPLAFSARAQWIVYDPTMNVQQILNEAESIAKYVTMIDNQVQQLSTLTSQLNDLTNSEYLVAKANGSSAMTYNNSGIYSTVGTSFQTPRGQTIQRPTNQYQRFSAIINTASNYVMVADNAAQRRATIKTNIAQTTQQLQNATTDAEVQKLHGVLTSLNGDLASTDDEVNQAASAAMVQDIQNRNDQQKQIVALTEQQNAEFEESVSNYSAKFQLLDAPTVFPTP